MPDDHSSNPESFLRRTEREFWLDPDRVNRWTPALNDQGRPHIEDREGAGEECAACGTQIRWVCFVRHPARGAQGVGRCCIYKVVKALPEVQQAPYKEALSNLSREMRNAERRERGLPPTVSRKERLEKHIRNLEAVVGDPRLASVRFYYNDRPRNLPRDVVWYLGQLKQGRRNSSFQSALKGALGLCGLEHVFD